MRIVLICAAALVIVIAPAGAEVEPQTNWRSLQTPHFYVLGNTGERTLRDVARRLEQFREATALMLPRAVHDSPVETTVLVFRSHKSYDPFKPVYQGKTRKMIAGYFRRTPYRNYITLTTEGGGLDNLRTIYHEYFHLLVSHTLVGAPVWFNEGLAEFYESFDAFDKGRRGSVGKVNSGHMRTLRQQFIPLEELVSVGHGSPTYNEGNRVGVFYAESWALVHYLALGEDQQLAPKIGPFVTALSQGASLDKAANDALGMSGKELEQRLRRYIEREQLSSMRMQFTEALGALASDPATDVDVPDVHTVLGDLLLAAGRWEEAGEHLDLALEVDPSYGPAHALYARIYAQARRTDLALQHLKQAVHGHEVTYRTSYDYAMALSAVRSADGSAGIDAAEIEAALRRTIELNPKFPDAYEQLAWHRQQDDPDEAIRLLQRAIALVPGREDYVLMLARLLVEKDDTAGPIIMERLAQAAADPDIRASAEREVARLEAIAQRRAAAAEHRARIEETRRAHRETASSAGASEPRSLEVVSGEEEGSAALDEPVKLADLFRSLPADAARNDGYVAQYRDLAPGERRLEGRLLSILCDARGLIVRVDIDGEIAKLRAESFDVVDFVSYRDDLSGRIECGPRLDHDPVFVTFRPDTADALEGTVVAVEFLRD